MTDSTAERQILELWNEVVTLREERDHYMALSAMNNAEALRSALARALRLLRIGMDVGLEPHEKDEANALLAVLGHEPVRLSDQTEACPGCGMKPALDGMWHKPGCPEN